MTREPVERLRHGWPWLAVAFLTLWLAMSRPWQRMATGSAPAPREDSPVPLTPDSTGSAPAPREARREGMPDGWPDHTPGTGQTRRNGRRKAGRLATGKPWPRLAIRTAGNRQENRQGNRPNVAAPDAIGRPHNGRAGRGRYYASRTPGRRSSATGTGLAGINPVVTISRNPARR